jgi:hypothetical protein
MAIKMGFDGRWKGPRNVGTKTLGTAWGDIGTAMGVGGAMKARVFLSLQIHAGTSVRFRMVGQYNSTSSAFGLIAQHHAGTGIVTVDGQAYQLTQDADQDISLPFELDGCVPYAKLQGIIAAGSATYVSNARLVTSL